MTAVSAKIQDLVDAGWSIGESAFVPNWQARVHAFLEKLLGTDVATEFNVRGVVVAGDWRTGLESQIGFLEALALLETQKAENLPASSASALTSQPAPHHTKRVFVVHGHDEAAKEAVARFLERIELEPVVLHEKPSSGRTVIEKFEALSNVGFAVVLLTPDDVGYANGDTDKASARARQNVILELGYFMGRLTRRRVCALYKHGVEIPSDYLSVLYVELDTAGAWRTKLAQELIEAGFSIKLEALVK